MIIFNLQLQFFFIYKTVPTNKFIFGIFGGSFPVCDINVQ